MNNSIKTEPDMADEGQHNREQRSKRIVLLAGLIIAVCTAAAIVHWPCLSSTARGFDDRQYLYDNELIQNPSWSSVKRFFGEVFEPSSVMGYYHPLSMTSLMLDYAMAGSTDNLRVFHRTSLILHVLNTALVIILLYLLFKNVLAAALVGLLFAVHPLMVEPVCWISDRKTLLASFFAFFSVVCYLIYYQKSIKALLAGSLFLYILALLSKPTVIGLPVMMIVLDWWPLKRFSAKSVLEKVPFFIISGISVVITYISHSRRAVVVVPDLAEPLRVPMLMCHNMMFYLYKMVWPFPLTAHYPFPETVSLSEPMILAGVVGTCILIPILVLSLFKTRAVASSWLIYFVMLLPTMQIIGFTLIIIASDKFAYFPSIGVLILLTFIIVKLLGTSNTVNKKHVAVIAVVLLIAGGEIYATRSYLNKWQDSLTFYKYMISITPDAAPPNNMMGYELKQRGRTDEAEAYFLKALRTQPNSFFAHNNLGTLYAGQGKLDQAEKHLKLASQARPNVPGVQMNLAILFMLRGDTKQATFYLKRALELKGNDAGANYSLGLLLQKEGKLKEACEYYRKTVALKPDHVQAWYNLSVAQQLLGKNEAAIESLRECLKVQPNFAEAHNNLGLLMKIEGRFEEAIEHFRVALAIKPDYARAHNNLGSVLVSMGEIDEGIEHFEKALELEPNYEKAAINLKSALKAKEGASLNVIPQP